MSDKPTFPSQNRYAFSHSVVVPDGNGGHYYSACAGMTQRDYFAAAALTGYLAHHGEPRKTSMDGPSEEEQRRVASLKMCRWADAMLAAGEGTK